MESIVPLGLRTSCFSSGNKPSAYGGSASMNGDVGTHVAQGEYSLAHCSSHQQVAALVRVDVVPKRAVAANKPTSVTTAHRSALRLWGSISESFLRAICTV
jgi:hypothetical protein